MDSGGEEKGEGEEEGEGEGEGEEQGQRAGVDTSAVPPLAKRKVQRIVLIGFHCNLYTIYIHK